MKLDDVSVRLNIRISFSYQILSLIVTLSQKVAKTIILNREFVFAGVWVV